MRIPPRGLRFLTVVNNTDIGILYLATSLVFFILAGILALILRSQFGGAGKHPRQSRF